MPFTRAKKTTNVLGSKIPKLGNPEKKEDGPQAKRPSSPSHGAPKKRTAFVDITNAHKVQISLPGKKKDATKKTTTVTKKPLSKMLITKNQANLKKSSSVNSGGQQVEKVELKSEEKVEIDSEGSVQLEEVKEESELKSEVEELATTVGELEVANAPPAPRTFLRPQVPEEFDVDTRHEDDCFRSPEFAVEIFAYLKRREEKFVLSDYMSQQPTLSPGMRAILVDWLVEVQENFELNHETLYLAVKLVDHFLAIMPVARETLQLIGSTTMLIASKFEERSPPCMDDFLYVCDDAYKRDEFIAMETNILQTLGFDINIPVPYRFLRRYAMCADVPMETLTLARYMCERSLLELEFLPVRGSLLASACLLVAMVTNDLGGWTPLLEYHSGYGVDEVGPVARSLQAMLLSTPDSSLKAVRNKYSHEVFFKVALQPVVDISVLENALSQ